MNDGIIKNDGTSRLLHANLPATYEELRAAAAAGTQPIDILFNVLGWQQLPTYLNKANLLKDATAALFGLPNSAVPDDVFARIGTYINTEAVKIEAGSYVGTGTYGQSNPTSITFGFVPKFLIVYRDRVVPYDGFMSDTAIWITGVTMFKTASSSVGDNAVSISDKTITWYTTSRTGARADNQLNSSNITYNYLAIG